MLDHEKRALLDLLRKSTSSDWCGKEFSHELVRIVREDEYGRLPLILRKKRKTDQTRSSNCRKLTEALIAASERPVSLEVLPEHRDNISLPLSEGNIILALTKMSETCDEAADTVAGIQRLIWVVLSVQVQLMEFHLPNQGKSRASCAAIAEIAKQNGVEATILGKLVTAGKKIVKLMGIFGPFSVLFMTTLSRDFLCTKLSDVQIEDVRTSLEGSKMLNEMHKQDWKACDAIMVALERLGASGFDTESFKTSNTDLRKVLESSSHRTLQRMSAGSQELMSAIRQEQAEQPTSSGQWRPRVGTGRGFNAAEGEHWASAPVENNSTSILGNLARPLAPFPDTQRALEDTPVSMDLSHQLQGGNAGSNLTSDSDGNTIDPRNLYFQGFQWPVWSQIFEGASQTLQ